MQRNLMTDNAPVYPTPAILVDPVNSISIDLENYINNYTGIF